MLKRFSDVVEGKVVVQIVAQLGKINPIRIHQNSVELQVEGFARKSICHFVL